VASSGVTTRLDGLPLPPEALWGAKVTEAQAAEAALVAQTMQRLNAADQDPHLSEAGRKAAHQEALRAYEERLTVLDTGLDQILDTGESRAAARVAEGTALPGAAEQLAERMRLDTFAKGLEPEELAERFRVELAGNKAAAVWAEAVPLLLRAAARGETDETQRVAVEMLVERAEADAEAWRDTVNPRRAEGRAGLEAISAARTAARVGRMGRSGYGERFHMAFAALEGHNEATVMRWLGRGAGGTELRATVRGPVRAVVP